MTTEDKINSFLKVNYKKSDIVSISHENGYDQFKVNYHNYRVTGNIIFGVIIFYGVCCYETGIKYDDLLLDLDIQ